MKLFERKLLCLVTWGLDIGATCTLQNPPTEKLTRAMQVSMTWATKKTAFALAVQPPVIGYSVFRGQAVVSTLFIMQ